MKKRFYLILGLSFIFVSVFSFVVMGASSNQAPEIQSAVEVGELPPLNERLPEDPYVVEPSENIGEYGGTVRTAGLSPEGDGDDQMLASPTMIVKPNAEGTDFIPHFAKKLEVSDDMTTYTVYFRKGVKWSDGEPFSADDIMFWYEDVLLNEDLTPVIFNHWKADDEVMKMKKIDDYTVKIEFSGPQPFFRNVLFMNPQIIVPKHYLKQFHSNYTEEDELEKLVEEEGFDDWMQLYENKSMMQYSLPLNPELPTLTAYRMVKKDSSQRVFERNPYFWKVDSEGNQLPYIENIVNEFFADKEVYNGRIMSGEVDFAGFNTELRNYPMYRKYEEDGDYRTILWDYGNIATIYQVNQTSEDPQLREIFQELDFRKALSHAIDREEINDTFYFGKGKPMQYTVFEESKYYEPEFAEAYIEFNPDRARSLLDDIGIKDTNDDGWREFPDGDKISFTIEVFPIEVVTMNKIEVISEYWQEIGLDVNVKQISGELISQRAPANMINATVWTGGEVIDTLFPMYVHWFLPMQTGWSQSFAPEWGRWFQTEGDEGEEPPEDVKQQRKWWEDVLKEPDAEKRIELGKNILRYQAENLWVIGDVGKIPQVLVAQKDLRNVPEDGIWAWATLWTMTRDPEQIYFEK